MKTIQGFTLATAAALLLGGAGAAWAQPQAPHQPPQRPPVAAPVPPYAQPQKPAPAPVAAPPQHRPGVQPPPPPHAGPKRLGAGPQGQWVKGSKVPSQFRTPHYVVQNWRQHGLKRPPHGQQWVQYGGDYLLVRTSNGLVVDLVIGR